MNLTYENVIHGTKIRNLANYWVEYDKYLENTDGIKGTYPVIYCHIHDLARHAEIITKLASKCVLITHNSDGCVRDTGFRSYDASPKQVPHNVVKWYAQNVMTSEKKDLIVPIPIGLENKHLFPYDKARMLFDSDSHPSNIKQEKDVYVNMQVGTNADERSRAVEAIKDNPKATLKLLGNFHDYQTYINDIVSHKATLSPTGNGLDCHRTYEILCLSRIPIMTRIASIESFGLPIVFLKNWYQIKYEYQSVIDLVDAYLQDFDKANLDAMIVDYWAERIKNAR